MTLQVLIATMNQNDHSLLDRMNIQSDAIVVNQSDRDEVERFEYKGHSILWITANERGLSLSRNTALMRATADIILFSDEDIVYYDEYPRLIEEAFEYDSDADIIIMDLKLTGNPRNKYVPHKHSRVRWFNALRHGTPRFACKRDFLWSKGITFNLLFGSGSKYSYGEEGIVLTTALKKGAKIWTSPNCIGEVDCGESTWFKGFDEKYFYNKGVVLETLYGKKAYFYVTYMILKNRGQTAGVGLFKAIKQSFKGISDGCRI